MRKATAIKLNINSLKHCFQSYAVLLVYPDRDRRPNTSHYLTF
nr:MAG TPA: hypothetical protein [Caudoviricetes sp.]